MPLSRSDILPSEGVITPMWAVSCAKYGIQGAFRALDSVFGDAFTAQEGPSAPKRAPPKLTEGHVPSVPPPPPSGCAPVYHLDL